MKMSPETRKALRDMIDKVPQLARPENHTALLTFAAHCFNDGVDAAKLAAEAMTRSGKS